jgi:dihydrofolate reductase
VSVSLIAAMTRDGLIGDGRRLPWHLPRDLRRFRRLTLGKPVIMGRRTFESLGRPLDGRRNIVLTRRPDFRPEGVAVARSLAEALELARMSAPEGPEREIMVIGGAEVYREALPLCDRLYLTIVEGKFEGSAYFPIKPDDLSGWQLVHDESFPADPINPYGHQFLTFERPCDQDR